MPSVSESDPGSVQLSNPNPHHFLSDRLAVPEPLEEDKEQECAEDGQHHEECSRKRPHDIVENGQERDQERKGEKDKRPENQIDQVGDGARAQTSDPERYDGFFGGQEYQFLRHDVMLPLPS